MLKTVIDNTEGLDEAIKNLYTENNGVFSLQLEGVDNHPDVANLKSAYVRVKADLVAVKAERDQLRTAAGSVPEDFDPEKWAQLKDGKPDEAALVSLRKEMEGTITELQEKLSKANDAARDIALERDLGDALTNAGVTNPSFLKAARAVLSGDIKVDETGKAFADSDMGPIGVSDYVSRWAAGDGKDFVTAPRGGGGKGNDGGTVKGDNPFAAKTLNLSKQAEMLANDPAGAAIMQANAGQEG